jgi:hypothetical protein
MKNTIKKNKEGYGYKYTELAEINKYCLENNITYYQEVETCEINGKDYIITYINDGETTTKHRGCEIVKAVLQGIKNPVQEYGSSLTYCRRYSLLMALGLATEDDDAQSLTEPNEPTKEEAEEYKLTFGKHKGLTIKELPEEYIDWLLGNSKDNYLLKCVELVTGKKQLTEEEQKELADLTVELVKLMSKAEDETDFNREDLYNHYETKSLSIEQTKEAIKILKKKLGE